MLVSENILSFRIQSGTIHASVSNAGTLHGNCLTTRPGSAGAAPHSCQATGYLLYPHCLRTFQALRLNLPDCTIQSAYAHCLRTRVPLLIRTYSSLVNSMASIAPMTDGHASLIQSENQPVSVRTLTAKIR